MAVRRPLSEKIFPIVDPLGRRRKSKGNAGKNCECDVQRSVLKLYTKKFQVVGGGGAYGLRRVSLNPSSQSLRTLTPDLPVSLTNRSTTSLHHASTKRIHLRTKPVHQPPRPALRSQPGVTGVKARSDFSPEYFRELGNMLRLQVRQGDGEETRECRSIETQASRWTVGRKLASLVTCSQWRDQR